MRRRHQTHEVASGFLVLPGLIAVSGTLMAILAQTAENPPAAGAVEFEVIRLLLTLVSSGGIVYLVVQRALGIWERGRLQEAKRQETMLSTFQAEIAALRERDEETRERVEQRCREDITYYRDLFVAERARVDACQAQVMQHSGDKQ